MNEVSRRGFLKGATAATSAVVAAFRALPVHEGAPKGAPDAYATPMPMIDGPSKPTWESLRDNYHVPSWSDEAKFGIFIHWGLYSIPARINEWYIRHMYTNDVEWHTQHFGPPDKFGYKDFIPLFKVPEYHPQEWAALFQAGGCALPRSGCRTP